MDEIKKRTFWCGSSICLSCAVDVADPYAIFRCAYNLDRVLSRILARPFTLVTPSSSLLTLPINLDPDTLGWDAAFDFHAAHPDIYHGVFVSSSSVSTLASGFIHLCELNVLATAVVSQLFTGTRDLSQDWRSASRREPLEKAARVYDQKLAALRAGLDPRFAPEVGQDDQQVLVLRLAIAKLTSDVSMFIREPFISNLVQRRRGSSQTFFAVLLRPRFPPSLGIPLGVRPQKQAFPSHTSSYPRCRRNLSPSSLSTVITRRPAMLCLARVVGFNSLHCSHNRLASSLSRHAECGRPRP